MLNTVNVSLMTGVVTAGVKSAGVKSAVVKPLLKKPHLDPGSLNTYRTVSSLPLWNLFNQLSEPVIPPKQHLLKW